MASDYRNRGWNDDDDDDERMSRPSGGGIGSSSIAYESGRRRSSRRRLIASAVVVAILGAFIVIVWNAYNQGQQSGGDGVVPLIHADNTPIKVRPDQPGGMDVPNQDKLIYDRLNPGQNAPPTVERLLPPPEAPMARPEPVPAPSRQAEAQPAEPSSAPQAPAQPSDLEPPTIATRPQTVVPPTTPPEPAKPQATQTKPEAPAAGGYKIQLGAVRSQDAAQKEWARLLKANEDLLGNLTLNVSQANLGERGTFYRIQAGPVSDQQAASALCGKLKARKVSCIIVKQ